MSKVSFPQNSPIPVVKRRLALQNLKVGSLETESVSIKFQRLGMIEKHTHSYHAPQIDAVLGSLHSCDQAL